MKNGTSELDVKLHSCFRLKTVRRKHANVYQESWKLARVSALTQISAVLAPDQVSLGNANNLLDYVIRSI